MKIFVSFKMIRTNDYDKLMILLFSNEKTNTNYLSITFTVNENLQKVAANLTHYVKYESWKFCDKCLIVEPKKMLPTYGNQKLRHITSCICTKGRYFVPMVRVYFLLITNSKTVIYYTYMYTYILVYIYIYIYIYHYV